MGLLSDPHVTPPHGLVRPHVDGSRGDLPSETSVRVRVYQSPLLYPTARVGRIVRKQMERRCFVAFSTEKQLTKGQNYVITCSSPLECKDCPGRHRRIMECTQVLLRRLPEEGVDAQTIQHQHRTHVCVCFNRTFDPNPGNSVLHTRSTGVPRQDLLHHWILVIRLYADLLDDPIRKVRVQCARMHTACLACNEGPQSLSVWSPRYRIL